MRVERTDARGHARDDGPGRVVVLVPSPTGVASDDFDLNRQPGARYGRMDAGNGQENFVEV